MPASRLLRATAALGILIAGCGGNSVSATHSAARSATATTSTAAAAAAGARLRGADYALTLARGWRDTTASHRGSAAVDRVIARRSPRAVAVIALLPARRGVATATLLRDRARSEIAGAHATASTSRRPLTLDGEQAITYQYRATSSKGAKVQARQVLVVHGGRLHVVTLVASRASFGAADTALGAMLGGWRWTTA